MAVIKSITISDALYAQWIDYHARHPEKFFNQMVREGLEKLLQEDRLCVNSAPSSTTP